jgi:hypothetical protein
MDRKELHLDFMWFLTDKVILCLDNTVIGEMCLKYLNWFFLSYGEKSGYEVLNSSLSYLRI